tara:strand:- start:2869 stop:4761 length:1893 start_codon:yes stop_codon:yes gene_type:complete
MSLRDLYNDPASFKYNSKDNKYDKDIRGGGYSGQPWQKATVPQTLDQLNSLTTEALSLDYPIRGGSYSELAARADFARIDAFLLSYPGGKAFLDKQKGLQFSNPLIESGRSGGDVNTRLYSDGRNLMTQVADSGTGFHYPQSGRTLNELTYDQNKYEYIVASKPTQQNRLVTLYNLKINPEPPTSGVSTTALNLGINTNIPGNLFFYSGGPSSVYGLGQTLIQRAKNSRGGFISTNEAPLFIGSNSITDVLTGDLIQSRRSTDRSSNEDTGINYNKLTGLSSRFELGGKKIDNDVTDQGNSIGTLAQQSSPDFIRADKSTESENPSFQYTMGYNDLLASKDQGERGKVRKTTDFRQRVINPKKVNKRNYESSAINKTRRIGVGSPGARQTLGNDTEKTDTSKAYTDGQDKVNLYDIEQNREDNKGIGGFSKIEQNRDIIKFVFETINNDNPKVTDAMFFRAFLTGYSDNHSAQWDSKKYAGRGENFYTYQGFERNISFNFKVAAQSKQEMRYIYRKLNSLLSSLYPDYNSTGFMRGNITKLTIGDLFVRTPGVLTSLNLTVADEYSWEIAMNEPEGGSDRDMLEVPQIIDVAVSFIPILNVLPKKGISSPILLTAGSNSSTNAYKWLNNV